jgi:hypothetical protein
MRAGDRVTVHHDGQDRGAGLILAFTREERWSFGRSLGVRYWARVRLDQGGETTVRVGELRPETSEP